MTDIILTEKKIGRQRLTTKIINERIADRGLRMVGAYVNSVTKTTFQCAKGHQWDATPNSVMSSSGCPHCSGKAKLTKDFVNERIADRGIRMVGNFAGNKSKSTFECGSGHQWSARVNNVMGGKGCPQCAIYNFDQSKPAILYYLRVDSPLHGTKYKIGITNRTVEQRFSSSDFDKIHVVSVTEYPIGRSALAAETDILRHFRADRYEGDPILSSGNTELFTRDVLRLDLTRRPEVV